MHHRVPLVVVLLAVAAWAWADPPAERNGNASAAVRAELVPAHAHDAPAHGSAPAIGAMSHAPYATDEPLRGAMARIDAARAAARPGDAAASIALADTIDAAISPR